MMHIKQQHSNKGFTLVELIVVVLILGLLSAVAVPALVGYLDKSKEGVCAHNRATIVRVYHYQKLLNESLTLEAVIDDAEGAQTMVTDATCPSGGSYKIDAEGAVICTYHGGAGGEDTGGNTGGGDTGGDTGGGDTGGGDTGGGDTNPATVEEKLSEMSTDWGAFLEELKKHPYGMDFERGTLISDESGFYYVARNDQYISGSHTGSVTDYDPNGNTFAQIDTSKVFTSADYNEAGKWSTTPKVGSLYEYEDALYVCVHGPSSWMETKPTSNGSWERVYP